MDEGVIKRWWAKWPDAEIGVPMPEGTVAVDIDDLEAVQAAEARGELYFPETEAQQTRSGGYHFFYRTDGRPVPQVVKRGGIGLDTRSGGKGYVIAYNPAPFDVTKWPMAPEWLYASAPAQDAPARAYNAPMGTRDDVLAWLGGIALEHHEWPVSDWLVLLIQKRTEGGIVALDPARPWSNDDLAQLAGQAYEWAQDAPEWWDEWGITWENVDDVQAAFDLWTAGLIHLKASEPPTDEDFPTLWSLITAYDPAKDAFTVEKLLRPGYRCLLAAYEATGKTYIAIQMALNFIHPEAGPLFGTFAVNEPLAVCYVDGEIGDGEFIRRSKALASELGVSLENDEQYLRVLTLDKRVLSLKDAGDVAFIGKATDRMHERTGRKVVLFLDSTDSLYGKVLWGGEAEPFDAAIGALFEGRRDWLIIITLVHTVKKPRDQKSSYRVDLQDVLGNVTRQADAVMVIDTDESELKLRMGVYKRPGRSQGILQRDADRSAWTWTHDIGQSGPDAWKVKLPTLKAIMLQGWWTADALTTRLEAAGTKLSRTTVRGYLNWGAENEHFDTRMVETARAAKTEYRVVPETD